MFHIFQNKEEVTLIFLSRIINSIFAAFVLFVFGTSAAEIVSGLKNLIDEVYP